MFRLMLQKLLHKKWMVLCLLIGNVLLIATAVSYPLYKNASLKRMLDDDMAEYADTHKNADIMSFSLSSQNGSNRGGFDAMTTKGTASVKSIGITINNYAYHYNLVVSNCKSLLARDDAKEQQLEIGTVARLSETTDVLAGRMCLDTVDEEGCIEAVVTTDALVTRNLLVGETLEFPYVKDINKNPLRFKIVGVVREKENAVQSPWIEEDTVFDNEILISANAFKNLFLGDENFSRYYIRCKWFYGFDLKSIKVKNIPHIIDFTDQLVGSSSNALEISEPGYLGVLKDFVRTENKVHVTLIILQVPVMALLLAFLFMISGQMLSMEQNEISLLKSRGASKRQIGRLYLLQSVILDVLSCVVGIPLGIIMCQLIGSSEAFLEFNFERLLRVSVNGEVLLYALIASLASVLVTLIPALSASGLTIVKLKQKKARSSKKLWQKLYLDVIILAASLYGYYTFSLHTDDISADVLAGKPLDPLLYLSSVLFILGCGMIFLRIQPWIVKLIFVIGKKKWKPAAYSSFLQIIRTGQKQQFVMLFLVLTVSLGIFDSTVARTIISNAESNIEYMTGDDVVVVEAWPNNLTAVQFDPTVELKYTEPDFGKYETCPGVEKVARVYIDDLASFKVKNTKYQTRVMAIDTKEFGEAVFFDSTLLDKHINHYLNSMSQNPDAVIVSRSYESVYGYKIGDSITYYNNREVAITGKIVAFVDYWPQYRPTSIETLNDGTLVEEHNYLIISHLSTVQNEWGKFPYYIFIKKAADADQDFFYDFVEENDVKIVKYINMEDQKLAIRQDTLFQGTNGILTMSFIVILILCMAGYLIYWIMSIKGRELLFGVLRAMGMKKTEIVHMLFNEQLATGIFSIVVGGVVGVLASFMFVPMIQLAYAGENQVTPLALTIRSNDMFRLFAIILVMVVVCIVVLSRIISRMKITSALKLGED